MKPRQFIARIGKKKLAANGGKYPYSTISSPRKAVRKSKRSKSEFARIYGSRARAEFVKCLPCAACHQTGFSQNAHVLGNGGTGRKGDATTIAPLCAGPFTRRCHMMFDQFRSSFNRIFPDFDPEKAAAQTQIAWLSIKGEEK